MVNHPNRAQKYPADSPTPEQLIAAREAAGLTESQAALLVLTNLRSWQKWEAGESKMHPGLFELFRIKTQQL